MRPGPLTQLTLPLDILDIPPPLPPAASLAPDQVWEVLSVADRARVRVIWLRVMGEVIYEERGEDRAAAH